MHVPFEISPLPVARGDQAVREGLARLALTDLPGVVLEDTGADIDEALTYLRPLLPPIVALHPRGILQPFYGNPKNPDNDFHADQEPILADQKAIAINFHHTESGLVEGNFFRFTSAFLQDPRSVAVAKKSDWDWCGEKSLHDLIVNHGLVDDERLLPVCFRGLSRVGTTMVFKEGEPLFHGFVTQEMPRKSRAWLGDLAVHPAQNLTMRRGVSF